VQPCNLAPWVHAFHPAGDNAYGCPPAGTVTVTKTTTTTITTAPAPKPSTSLIDSDLSVRILGRWRL